MGTCADVYVKKEKNFFFNKPKDSKDPDSPIDKRETVEKVYIVFLTGQKKEDGGDMSVSIQENFLWGGTEKPSNLFKVIKGWFPSATSEQIRDMDLNNLIGMSAWITVTHSDSGYAKVTAATQPPPGAQSYPVPADYKRYTPEAVAQTQAVPVAQGASQTQGAYSGVPMGMGSASSAGTNQNPLPSNPGMNAVHQGLPNTNHNLPDSNPFRDIPNGTPMPAPAKSPF